MFHVPEKYRIKPPTMLGTTEANGNNGAFLIDINDSEKAFVVATNGMDWEHVSVHMIVDNKSEIPTWDEMCLIKNIFWDESDCVVQYHPPKSEYVNNHPHVLHLWRPIVATLPSPPSYLVGIKN